MLSNFFKTYRRLTWFLSVPSTLIGLVLLIRFFLLAKNNSNLAPGVVNPRNPVQLLSQKKFNLNELEEELGEAKRKYLIQKGGILSPLKFPDKDSVYEKQNQDIQENRNRIEGETEKLLSQRQNSSQGSKLNKHPDFFIPSQSDIENASLPNTGLIKDYKSGNPFNSYSKPDKNLEKTEEKKEWIPKKFNYLRTKIIDDQTIKEGSEIQLRTIQEAILDNVYFPINTLLNAHVSIEGNRLICRIYSVKVQGTEFPIEFISIGRDSQEGISLDGLKGNKKGFLKELYQNTKNQIANTTGQTINENIPIAGNTLASEIKKLASSSQNMEFKLPDGYEINFIPQD